MQIEVIRAAINALVCKTEGLCATLQQPFKIIFFFN